MIARAAAAGALLLALAACGLFGSAEKPHSEGPFYSPNGEPLSGGPLGNPSCADAMGRWFGRVDADHDGTVDLQEFLADARRQFAAMDLDRSGVLTPAELAQYRLPYIADRPRKAESDEDPSERERRRQVERDAPLSLDRADPVMLADTKLRNRVTLDDFLANAQRNFAALDHDKTGRLSRDETLAACPKK
ncbi:MAG TPA: hypothetical protein VN802_08460 [Stellaceae bacterium]|nr:hypothetical protein [Stellaceae bacterium]